MQLTHANHNGKVNQSRQVQERSGVSKVTPPGPPGNDQSNSGNGRASQPKFSDWPFGQFAEFRNQIAKLRLKTFEQDTEAKRKPEDQSQQQPGSDDVPSEARPVDPGE